MPLLIPGLDEAASKILAKRLHKSLKQQHSPTLTQVQTLLAQAVGHADWHAAQTYWQRPVAPRLAPRSFMHPEEKMRKGLREYLDAFEEAFEGMVVGKKNSDIHMQRYIQRLSRLMDRWAPYGVDVLLDRITQLMVSPPENRELFLASIHWLFTRVKIQSWPRYFPERELPILSAAPPGIVNDDFSPEERDRLNDQRRAQEIIDCRPEIQEFMGSLKEVVCSFKKVGPTPLPGFIKFEYPASMLIPSDVKSYIDAFKSTAGEASVVGFGSSQYPLLVGRMEVFEKRIRSGLLERFFPELERESFPSFIEEVSAGRALVGDWSLLEDCVMLVQEKMSAFAHVDYSKTEPVQRLCAWWNAHAPVAERHAENFIIGFIWHDAWGIRDMGNFIRWPLPMDLAKESGCALFESPWGFSCVVQFLKGTSSAMFTPDGVILEKMNGQKTSQIEMDLLNDSAVAMRALLDLSDRECIASRTREASKP